MSSRIFFGGHNIRMLQINNRQLSIISPNNIQYFWINRRDLETETKRNWEAIFDKYKESLSQKYRKELNQILHFNLMKNL